MCENPNQNNMKAAETNQLKSNLFEAKNNEGIKKQQSRLKFKIIPEKNNQFGEEDEKRQ